MSVTALLNNNNNNNNNIYPTIDGAAGPSSFGGDHVDPCRYGDPTRCHKSDHIDLL